MKTLENITLQEIINKQPEWFNKGNRKFFGDRSYWLRYSNKGNRYLVRSTYAWTDMFGSKKTLYYCINNINNDLTISGFVEDSNFLHIRFENMEDVNKWLKEN